MHECIFCSSISIILCVNFFASIMKWKHQRKHKLFLKKLWCHPLTPSDIANSWVYNPATGCMDENKPSSWNINCRTESKVTTTSLYVILLWLLHMWTDNSVKSNTPKTKTSLWKWSEVTASSRVSHDLKCLGWQQALIQLCSIPDSSPTEGYIRLSSFIKYGCWLNLGISWSAYCLWAQRLSAFL